MKGSLLFFFVASACIASTLGALFTSSSANALGSTTVAASSTASFGGKVILAGGLDSAYTFSLNITNTGSSSGTVSLSSLILIGVQLDASLTTPAIVGLLGNVGFQLNSTLTPGSYSVSLTLIPPKISLSAQTSLFYAFNATDGSNSASSSGSQNTNVYGAVPFTPVTGGITFQLRPVQFSTYLLANLDFTASTVVVPVLYGAANTLVANVNTTLKYGQQFSVSIVAQANTTATVTASAAANLAKNAVYKLQSNAQTAYSDAQAFFNITVTTTASTAYTLSFQLNSTVTQEQANLYVWAKVEVDGTLTLLQTASNTGKNIVASATSAGQYALFRSIQVANGTYEALVRNLAGNAQTTQRILLASFIATGQSTTTVSSSAYVFPAASNNLIQSAYNLAITASNSGSSGRINVYAVVLTSLAYQSGVQAGPSYTNTSTNAQLYYGVQVTSELTPGTFTVNLTFTASSSLQSQLQLYYLVNASDVASASGNAQSNVYSATSFSTTYGKTFTLPSSSDSTYLMGSYNTSLGFPLVGTVYGLPSTVEAGTKTLLSYGNAFLLQINSAAETSVKVVFSTSSNVTVNFGASSASYTSLNAFFEITVTDQSSLTANLYYPIDQAALASKNLAANSLTFVYIAADGTAQVLPTTQTNVNGQAVITATTNHFSTYAVYSGSQTNNNANPTNQSSEASQMVAAVALIFATIFAFAM